MRRRLICALEVKLVPKLLADGFSRVELTDEDKSVPQFRTAYPLGFFSRDSGRAFDLVDVAFDPNGAADFVVIASTVGKSGVDLPWGKHVPADQAHAGDALSSIELVNGKRGRRRFGPGLLSRKDDRAADKIALTATEKYDEIRTWFASGSVGPNIREHQIK